MGTWGGTILSQTKLCGTKTGAGTTITVGNAAIASILYTGAATIDSQITAVADIDDPAGGAGWTDLVDFTGGPYAIAFNAVTLASLFSLTIAAAEDAGDSLRLQILKDGDIIWDVKAVGDGANIQQVSADGTSYSNSDHTPSVGAIYCETSFKIRVARKGGFTVTTSKIAIADLKYNEVEKL